jgi:S-adenosylmethionine uptake transporter
LEAVSYGSEVDLQAVFLDHGEKIEIAESVGNHGGFWHITSKRGGFEVLFEQRLERFERSPSAVLQMDPEHKIGSRRAPGPAWMFGAVIAFGLMVLFVKLLREAGMSTGEVIVWRMGPGVPVAAWLLYRKGRSWRPTRPLQLLGRVAFGATAMTTYFWAIPQLSLFTNTSIALTQPIFVAALSPWLLRERASRAVGVAFMLALAGTGLVVSGRATDVQGWSFVLVVPLVPALVRLFSSASSATAHIFIRRTTREGGDPPDLVVLHFTGWVTLVSLLVGLGSGSLAGPPPSLGATTAFGYIAGMAGCGIAGQLMLSRAYARGRAPAVAVMGYVAIPLSLGLDALVWDVGVHPLQLVGVALTAIAGALLLFRRGR